MFYMIDDSNDCSTVERPMNASDQNEMLFHQHRMFFYGKIHLWIRNKPTDNYLKKATVTSAPQITKYFFQPKPTSFNFPWLTK